MGDSTHNEKFGRSPHRDAGDQSSQSTPPTSLEKESSREVAQPIDESGGELSEVDGGGLGTGTRSSAARDARANDEKVLQTDADGMSNRSEDEDVEVTKAAESDGRMPAQEQVEADLEAGGSRAIRSAKTESAAEQHEARILDGVGSSSVQAEVDGSVHVGPTAGSVRWRTWSPRGNSDGSAEADSWGSGTRIVAIGALLGMALVLLLQLSFSNDWLDSFVKQNALEMPLRMRLLASMAAGGALGAVCASINLFLTRRRNVQWHLVERYYWMLSPFILAPLAPPILRVEPWRNRPEELLPLMIVVLLFVEALLSRALANIPDRVVGWYEAVAARVPQWWKRRGPWAVVISAALFYALFFTFYTLRWHYKLRTHTFDVSINTNLLAGGLHGDFMHSTVAFPDEPSKYMGAHVKWGGYLFLPIFYLFPRAETLLVIQSTLLGATALPLFAFARKRVSDWAAVCVALAFLCYYPMHSANFYEVKYVPIATFFIVSTAWAVDAKRWVLFGLAFFAAALMREDVPIGLAVMGMVLLLSGHRPVPGLVMALVASIWFFILRFAVMDSVAKWWFPNMYKDLWAPGEKGFGSVIKTLLTNPLFVLQHVITEQKVGYLMHLLVPVALLPARRWYLWAAFIPGFILTLLATDYKPITIHTFQYVMHWTPYLFLAVPLALAAIAQSSSIGNRRAWAALLVMLISSGVLSFHFGAFAQREKAFKGGYFTVEFTYSEAERARYAHVQEFQKLVPADATISTTENVGPHFAARRYFYSMRHGTHNAQYVVAEKNKLDLGQTEKSFTEAVRSGKYGVVKLLDDLVLLKKGHDTALNAKLLRDWRL